ncbi:hypothetical protein E2C01_017269 [Portunus trituberculatus]|uniref:Uncharacterized protein n=1 Tax=Portunus trituberculatus TaxID=210409 RepID=A0A5B7DT63_PORTR|nr:hypothetical protein [Portunus trituberculatus]
MQSNSQCKAPCRGCHDEETVLVYVHNHATDNSISSRALPLLKLTSSHTFTPPHPNPTSPATHICLHHLGPQKSYTSTLDTLTSPPSSPSSLPSPPATAAPAQLVQYVLCMTLDHSVFSPHYGPPAGD